MMPGVGEGSFTTVMFVFSVTKAMHHGDILLLSSGRRKTGMGEAGKDTNGPFQGTEELEDLETDSLN